VSSRKKVEMRELKAKGGMWRSRFSGGRSPFQDKDLAGYDPYGKILSGKRPSIPEFCPKGIGRLMKLC